jgi:hypothetical protein
MPLKPGKSKATVSKNISEFHTGPTYARTKAKFGKETASRGANKNAQLHHFTSDRL